jgi:hypothetical protein
MITTHTYIHTYIHTLIYRLPRNPRKALTRTASAETIRTRLRTEDTQAQEKKNKKKTM